MTGPVAGTSTTPLTAGGASAPGAGWVATGAVPGAVLTSTGTGVMLWQAASQNATAASANTVRPRGAR